MDKVFAGLQTAWDWTRAAYHWVVDTIQDYPAVTFWVVAVTFVLLAFGRWH